MKRLFLIMITASLLLMPFAAYAADYTGSAASSTPPISQQLVREGDYAVMLAGVLNLGNVEDETQAEDILAAAGIAPTSGWISNFPVTPDIIAEIQASIDAAADAGKLSMGREDAENAFFALNSDIGISITPASGEEPSAEPSPAYSEPAVINNYYYEEGPPVITYYAPPPDYWYLYAWNPWPFWCDGFFFPGFFVLTDFDFVFIDGHHHHRDFDRDDFRFYRDHDRFWAGDRAITNHITDPATGKSVRVDPVTRRPAERTAFKPIGARSAFTPLAGAAGGHGRRIAENTGGGSFNRKSAANLFDRSVSRADRGVNRTGAGAWRKGEGGPSAGPSRQWSRSTGTPSIRTAPSWSGSNNGRTEGGSSRPPAIRSYDRPSARTYDRSTAYRGRSYSAPPMRSGGSYSVPQAGGRSSMSEVGRSFGGGFGGGGRSYSAPSGGSRSFGGGGRSFSAPSGGSRSFGGGGRSSGGGGFGGMKVR